MMYQCSPCPSTRLGIIVYSCQFFHKPDFRFGLFLMILFHKRIILPSDFPHRTVQAGKLQGSISAENGITWRICHYME